MCLPLQQAPQTLRPMILDAYFLSSSKDHDKSRLGETSFLLNFGKRCRVIVNIWQGLV